MEVELPYFLASMAITISAAHRDLLYDRILVHLSGIDGVWLAAREKNYEAADRLGREYCDELRLLMDDLGWGERSGADALELTSPPDVVRRVMQRLKEMSEVDDAQEQKERVALREAAEENRQVREACDEVLAALASS
jgi:hypothetical protein